MDATHPGAGTARIGPNALIQTLAALEEQRGPQEARRFLRQIGRGDLAERLPAKMVDEHAFIGLIGALRADLGVEAAGQLLARSGELTAAYLLAHRIPAPARAVLPLLPRRAGLSLLLRAIAAHAWTFAGSGRFSYSVDRTGAVLRLAGCPECRGIAASAPICNYYAGCFQALLRQLIDRRLSVRETSCCAVGAGDCVFEVR